MFFVSTTYKVLVIVYSSFNVVCLKFDLWCLLRSADAEIVWCQEEPMNMGAYSYIEPRLSTAIKSVNRGGADEIKYVGRPPSAATATGFISMHSREQSELVQKALQPDPIPFP